MFLTCTNYNVRLQAERAPLTHVTTVCIHCSHHRCHMSQQALQYHQPSGHACPDGWTALQ